ncbi:MAG: hypothetical protein HY556_10450 [Euryarchaeota archaeon]|nr:hypothetical protein [Euryarchaeota archaeon]
MTDRTRGLRFRRIAFSRQIMVMPVVALVAVSSAGCLEAFASLDVFAAVSEADAFADFEELKITLRTVRGKPQGENPRTLDPVLDTVDLLGKVGQEPFLIAKGVKLPVGDYSRLDILMEPPQGKLANGTTYPVVAINNALIYEFTYPLQKDKTTSILVTMTLDKGQTPDGTLTYVLVEDLDRSGVR